MPEPPPPEADPIAAVALQLPPLADAVTFSVHDRGFFAGPQTAIQLDLLDRATGELLWSKAVSAEADPTDAKAMSSWWTTRWRASPGAPLPLSNRQGERAAGRGTSSPLLIACEIPA